jgi:NAD(P)H dehydrogenase (quinone)
MGGLPTDLISGVRYCIDDDKCRAFEPSAPTADALDSWLTQSAAL